MKMLALLRTVLFILGTIPGGIGVIAFALAARFVIIGISASKAGNRIAAGDAKAECILSLLIGVQALGLALALLVPSLILHLWIRRRRRIAPTAFPVLLTSSPPPAVARSGGKEPQR
jgi:hypothetical protein